MERLTQIENGMAYFPECFKEPCCGVGCAKENCDFINKKVCEALAAYEKLGLTPAQIAGVDNLYAAKCKEVAELQRQLENSVKLPCAYNDTMYWIVRGHIREVWFKDIRCDYGYKPQIICRYIDNLKTKETAICEVDQIGKTLFLTRDAAEKALSEVKA